MEPDVVVVGGGPAGLTAATWLGRYRRSVVLVDAGEHRNRWVDVAHGYLGADPVDPARLLARAQEQLGAYQDVVVCTGRAEGVSGGPDEGFTVEVGRQRLVGRRLVLATGVVDDFPQVDGFFEHYGADVFHCPTCDGYEAKGRQVVVLGWGAHVADFALGLRNWARQVTIVTDGRPHGLDQDGLEALDAQGIAVIEDEALALEGPRGALSAVRLRQAGLVPCTMAFFSIAHHPVTDLADALGCQRSDEGYVAVDHCGHTSVTGVYAAGDVTPGLQLIQAAAGQGAAAGVDCALSLSAAPPSPSEAARPSASRAARPGTG